MSYRKKLIEVALPLEEINKESALRKRKAPAGYPTQIHKWWAQRPIAVCRAVVFASIIDDPGEDGVPEGLLKAIDALKLSPKYRHLAEEEPLDTEGNPLSPAGEERERTARNRRYRLFTLMERLVQWENSKDEETLAIAQNLIKEACRQPVPPVLTEYQEILCWAFEQVGDSNRGYERWGDVAALAQITERCHAEFCANERFSASVEQLRGALFFTQRAHRMTDMGQEPDPTDVSFVRALYGAVRERWAEAEPDLPPLMDPFCGGGSIPLEAQRLGLETHASDLNPVAVLITKAMIEIPPRFADMPPVNPEATKNNLKTWRGAQGLAQDVRYYGKWMRDEAERRIGHLYPKIKVFCDPSTGRRYGQAEVDRMWDEQTSLIGSDSSLFPHPATLKEEELKVVAWLWARTATCPNPACLAEVPLVRSFALSTKKGAQAWLTPIPSLGSSRGVRFEIRHGDPSDAERKSIEAGTCVVVERDAKGSPLKRIRRVKATFKCPCCHQGVLKGEAIDDEANNRGLGVQPLAIVAEGKRGRHYLPFDSQHVSVSSTAKSVLAQLSEKSLPTETCRGTFASNAQGRIYGFRSFRDYFTDRQQISLATLISLSSEIINDVRSAAERSPTHSDLASEYATAIAVYLSFAISRLADYGNSLASWRAKDNAMRSLFSKQGIPMVWDFAEGNPLASSSSGIQDCAEVVARTLEYLPASGSARVIQMDARQAGAPMLVSTDPPYFENIGYSDLSDFFYVWLRRSLETHFPNLFSTLLTPKAEELIASSYRHAGGRAEASAYFQAGFSDVFRSLRARAFSDYPLTVYYAFKQSESEEDDSGDTSIASTGWETMLQGLVDAGFVVNGTWPFRTEGDNRSVSVDANALASCIVLVCRPRQEAAPKETRRGFLVQLRKELRPALTKLTQGNVAPVDLAQAAIGPGMAVFSRYSAVLEADGKAMRVRTALGLINQALDEAFAEQEGWYDPQTRWSVTWFKQYGFSEGPYGEAEILATAKSAPVRTMVEAGIVLSGSSKVKLLTREELREDYDPKFDPRTTIWEATQYLARALDKGGELAAAQMMRRFRETKPDLEVERARDLAYRLYAICDSKRQAVEARVYNALVLSWSDIEAVSQTDEAAWVGAPSQAANRKLSANATLLGFEDL